MSGDKGKIMMAHGGGGRLARELISSLLLKHFTSGTLAPLADSALLNLPPGRVAFTTDSHVVRPLFFPGGDIGRLAVCGTVNDLAVMGATPMALSCALIIEEGFPVEQLEKALVSMKKALEEAEVAVVTGDTKVVERGAADGLFINTAGIGVILGPEPGGAGAVEAGDLVIVSGYIGDHGVAVMAKREGLGFEAELESDCAPVNGLVAAVLEAAPGIKFMRDPTRGGLAATLNELAESSGMDIEVGEKSTPVRNVVAAYCELLGLDPFHVANEGKIVVVTPPREAVAALKSMRTHTLGSNAEIIGEITLPATKGKPRVYVRTPIGGVRILSMPAGEQLPRIC